MSSINKPKIFYGWRIVGIGFLTQFIGIGVQAYATPVFFQAMFTDLKWSRGDLALSMSVGMVLAVIVSPFVGVIVDRYGVKWIMSVSALVAGGCLIMLGYVHELWQAFIIFSLLTVFRVGFVSIPVMTMISNWFSENRGKAMGITTAGQGLGGFVLSPLASYLISSIGWRMAWGVMGILTWIAVIPSALLVAKLKPELIGLLADGKGTRNGSISSVSKDGKGVAVKKDTWTIKSVLRTPTFWLLAVISFLYFFGHISIFQHSFSLFTDRGIPAMTAGTMIGVLGLFSLSGKLGLGYLSDKLSARHVMMIALALSALSTLPLIWAEPTLGAWLFIVFWGFWECGVIAVQPILVGSLYDRAIIGKMLGIFTMFTALPNLIGPPFLGYIFDIKGNYNLALSVIVIFYIVSLILIFFIRPSRHTIFRNSSQN